MAEGLLDPRTIRALAAELGLRPTKQRGQNFVHDANTVRRIVAASGVGADDAVLEVGPGLGSLTLGLLEATRHVTAVEIEASLAHRLPRTVAERLPEAADRLTVVEADALEVDALPDPQRSSSTEPLHLLIVGGSLGARVLNEQVPASVAAAGVPIEVRHQSGKGNRESVAQAYAKQGVEAEVSEFIKDMADAYAWADLVVCRAGALTVSEVAAAGVAAIFVPLPHAVDDHQTRNALTLVDGGAAEFLPQSELTTASLAARLSWLAGRRETLLNMAQAARRVAITDAAERVADECKRLAAGQNEREL